MKRSTTNILSSRGPDKRIPSRLRRYVNVAAAVCIGGGLSVALFATVIAWKWSKTQLEFHQAARDRVSLIKRQVETNLLAVRLLGSFLSGADELQEGDIRALRREFRAYVLPVLSRHPNIQALRWAPRVPYALRSTYEQAARQAGHDAFEITERQSHGLTVPAAPRDEYFPIYFALPQDDADLPMGVDLAANPTRLAALNLSRDTGETVITGRIVLVQEADTQFGVLIIEPVYRRGAPTDTVEARRQNLEGFSLGVLRTGDLVEDAVEFVTPKGIDVRLVDASADEDKRFLYAYSSRLRNPRARGQDTDMRAALEHYETFDVGGRTWGVLCMPTEDFLATRIAWEPWVVLLVGYLLTGTVVLYISSAVRHAAHIDCLAKQLAGANHDLNEEITQRKKTQKQLARTKGRLQQANTTLQWRQKKRADQMNEDNERFEQL